MVEAVSILFIAAGVALAVWWAVTDQPQKMAGFAASLFAIVAGAVLTGCEQKPTETSPVGTNAPAVPAAPSTNK